MKVIVLDSIVRLGVPYPRGTVAEFPDDEAELFIQRGLAVRAGAAEQLSLPRPPNPLFQAPKEE